VTIPEVENEVTRSEWLGASSKDVETLIGNGTKQRVPADRVQDLVLAELASGEKERKHLDRVANERLGVNADTVYKSGLAPLKDGGRIKAHKDGLGGWCWKMDEVG